MRRLSSYSAYFLGLMFILAGADKLAHYRQFIVALDGYVVMPKGAGEFLGLPLILIEFWIGVGLLRKRWKQPAAFAALALLSLFVVVVLVNYLVAPGSACACWFSITMGSPSVAHVALDLLLACLAGMVWREGLAKRSREPHDLFPAKDYLAEPEGSAH